MRAILDRPRPVFRGGVDEAVPDSAVCTRLRNLLTTGVLARKPTTKIFAGRGAGNHTCVACGSPINEGDIEFEIAVVNEVTLFFHRRCADLWIQEADKGAAAAQ
jgi:hypothetical protein